MGQWVPHYQSTRCLIIESLRGVWNDKMTIETGFRTDQFLLKWSLANLAGVLLVFVLVLPIQVSSGDQAIFKGFAGVAIGLGLGFPQWLVLRRYLRNAGWWLVATGLGFALGGILLGFGTTPELARRGLSSESVGVVLGASASVLQWLVLRPQVEGAGLWIPANTAAFGLGWWVNWSIDFGLAYESLLSIIVGLLVLVIPYLVISGLAMTWLLRKRAPTFITN